jgi:4-hydroxythreonine-4-phosphate dehydrogenase
MKRIVVTIGDPAGVGPIVTAAALRKFDCAGYRVTVIGDAEVLGRVRDFKAVSARIEFVDMGNAGDIKSGQPSVSGGRAALAYLDKAIEICRLEENCSLVTAPVSKEMCAAAAGLFTGHTEYLRDAFGLEEVVMMMAGTSLRVVPMTRHIPLREVPAALNVRVIRRNLEITAEALKKHFNIGSPRIAFASVNPHAGIHTFLEKEEKTILRAIAPYKELYSLSGPLPSDTLFNEREKYDCIMAAYHDQAMIPFKLLDFYTGVNVTLGLPFVRTSPDHGTAYDLVENPAAIDHRSMLAALQLAVSS